MIFSVTHSKENINCSDTCTYVSRTPTPVEILGISEGRDVGPWSIYKFIQSNGADSRSVSFTFRKQLNSVDKFSNPRPTVDWRGRTVER